MSRVDETGSGCWDGVKIQCEICLAGPMRMLIVNVMADQTIWPKGLSSPASELHNQMQHLNVPTAGNFVVMEIIIIKRHISLISS